MASVELRDISKRFQPDGPPVLEGFDLSVADGEFLVLIGPSGCGKTTVLRIVAGLDAPDAGTVIIGDHDVTGTPTQDRDVAMVFQENTLFPFMTVERNMAFPLEIARVPQDERQARVLAEARVHDLEQLLERKPGTLSAGYQQMVQVAREMVRVPRVFLMDEPLARLDAAQRVRMRRELALLQRGFGVTTLYVTPDPAEAMALADRAAVLDAGIVQQVDEPMAIYRRPANRFVAEFFAPFPMNVLEAIVVGRDGRVRLDLQGGSLYAWSSVLDDYVGRRVLVGIRPEHVSLPSGTADPSFIARVERAEFMGDEFAVHLRVAGTTVLMTAESPATVGDEIEVEFPEHRLHLFDADTGTALAHPM